MSARSRRTGTHPTRGPHPCSCAVRSPEGAEDSRSRFRHLPGSNAHAVISDPIFFSPSPETFSWPSRLQGSLSVKTPNFNTPFTIWSSQKDPWPVMETSCPHSPSCRIFLHIYLFNWARSQLWHEGSWIFVAAWESFSFGMWGLVTRCCCCLAPMSSATLLRPHGL